MRCFEASLDLDIETGRVRRRKCSQQFEMNGVTLGCDLD